MKFSTKLTVLFSVIILIMGTGISFFVYSSNVKTLEAHIEDRLKNQAFHTMDKIDRFLFERYGNIKVFASDPVISSRQSTQKQITERLIYFKNIYRHYASLSFFDLHRVRIADTEGKEIGRQHALSEYWPEISGGRDFTFNISASESLKRAVFHFASVVKDNNGTPFGVVVLRVPLENLYEVISKAVGIYNVEKDFLIEMVDKEGVILYSNSDKEAIPKETSPDWGLISESIKKGAKTGVLKHSTEKEGEKIIVFTQEEGYEDFKGSGWTLIIEVPTKVAFASAVEIRNRILVISLIISFFAFVAARLLVSRISGTIERLSAASDEIAKGNLDVKVDVTSRDETRRLAETFNRMVSDLRESRERMLDELTEQKKAEEALQKNKDLLLAIIDNSTAVIYLKDLDGRYMLVNKWYETLFHYSREELTGKTDYDVFPKEMADAFRENDRKVLEAKKPVEFEEVALQDGKRHTYISIKFLLFDLSGKPYAVCGISTDITERKQMEEALKDYSKTLEERVGDRTRELESANAELKKIFNAIEQAAEAIMITDINGTIQYINPVFSLITGYSREDAIGQNPRILKSGENPPEMYTNLWNTILAGNIWKSTTINKKKSGELYYMEMTITPVIDEQGKIRNFVAIQNDVTDRVKTEEELRQKSIELEAAKDMAEAANRAKSEFLANMSHELRTPLNAVIGFSQVILDGMAGPVTPDQKEYTNDILESGRHLLSIISEILDLSRIEAGKEELELAEFPLEALIKESLMMFNEKAVKHNIKLTTDVAVDIGNIKADERKIKQVVINLLSNAMKFTPDGSEVSLQARRVKSSEIGVGSPERERVCAELITQHSGLATDFIEVSVEDTGIGIKEEDMQRLFRPFEQLEKHLTKQYPGTGLGLALCKKFVEMHNGRIWAESEPGKGTRFIFTIPVQQPS